MPNRTAPTSPPAAARPSKRKRTEKDQPGSGFRHTSLAAPERQIRLLRFISSNVDEDIKLTVSAWDIEEAPPYVAISYCWGSMDMEQLYIDCKPLSVRHNCRYALWQTKLHHPNAYVWIDSICIDQDSNFEKSYQVRMMGDIYEAASRVVACVSHHADNSQLVIEAAAEMQSRDLIPTDITELHGVRPLLELQCAQWDTIATATHKFLQRVYFTRLWVIQEQAAARDGSGLQMLCGPDTITRHQLESLVILSLKVQVSLFRESHSFGKVAKARVRSLTFEQVCSDFFDFGCADPRDRLYAVLSLVKWDDRGPLVNPDYDLSPMQLACRVCRHLAPFALTQLLQAFCISPTDAEIQALVAKRRVKTPSPARYTEQGRDCALKATTTCLQLQQDPDSSNLTASIHRNFWHKFAPGRWDLQTMESLEKYASSFSLIYAPIFSNTHPEEVVALTCISTEPGDILVPILGLSHPLLLVLRRNGHASSSFDVVGQAFCLQGYYPKDPGSFSQSSGGEIDTDFEADVLVELTSEDYIAFIGQDAIGDEGGYRYVSAEWMHRLVTNPVLSMEGVATVELVSDSENCGDDGEGEGSSGDENGEDEYGEDEYGEDEYGEDEYGEDEYGEDEYGEDESEDIDRMEETESDESDV